MKLTIYRDNSGTDSTLGRLCIGEGLYEHMFAYTLEDERRIEKIAGKTRIPAGTYEIKLRVGSPMADKYDARYHDISHSGMLWITEVPNFSYCYVHIGNTDEDTDGCPLIGFSSTIDARNGGGSIGRSTQAYKALYPKVYSAIESGEKVFLTIKDEGVK